jgi:hypothetical protein
MIFSGEVGVPGEIPEQLSHTNYKSCTPGQVIDTQRKKISTPMFF